MSLSSDRSIANRLNREIAALRGKEADEIKREAEANKKANAALASASRSHSTSTASMYHRTALAEAKKAETAQANRARHSNDIAKKSSELLRVQERIARGEEGERRKRDLADEARQKADEKARRDLAEQNSRLRSEYEARVTNLEAQIAAQIETQASQTAPFQLQSPGIEPYDFFLSHATADKEDFVDALVKKAEGAGLRVWYDTFQISWGDSIRQKIDEGLRNAFFGVVVLSPSFFSRPWPNYELDGILQRDISGNGRLLPIWHRLTQDDVATYAPSLAGRLALSTASSSSDVIVQELIEIRDRFKKVFLNQSEG